MQGSRGVCARRNMCTRKTSVSESAALNADAEAHPPRLFAFFHRRGECLVKAAPAEEPHGGHLHGGTDHLPDDARGADAYVGPCAGVHGFDGPDLRLQPAGHAAAWPHYIAAPEQPRAHEASVPKPVAWAQAQGMHEPRPARHQ